MKKCIIFAGGEIKNYSSVKTCDFLDKYIICADSGYIHAQKLGANVDVIIGDFDSINSIPTDNVENIKFQKEKDDTDTMLAVKLAFERGYKNIEIYGGLGNRFDHTYANIQTLDYISENGGTGKLVSDSEEIMLIKNQSIEIAKNENVYLSLFSYSEICNGVSIKGVKYPLNSATITQSFPIGISNEIVEDFAEISVKQGKILIILSKK